LQQEQQQLQLMQRQQRQAQPVQQQQLTPHTAHTFPDGGRGDSILPACISVELDAIKKVNKMHKHNQEKKTKRESEPSEKSIETPVRAIQPSTCGICKGTFMSRNALFTHLSDKHEFRREWKQRPEVEEEKMSPHACDASHTNQHPAAGT